MANEQIIGMPETLAAYLQEFPREKERLEAGLRTSLISTFPGDPFKKYRLYEDDQKNPCLYSTERQPELNIESFHRSQLAPEEIARITSRQDTLDAWVYKEDWRQHEKADPKGAIIYIDWDTNTLEAVPAQSVLNRSSIMGQSIDAGQKEQLLRGQVLELRFPGQEAAAPKSDVAASGQALAEAVAAEENTSSSLQEGQRRQRPSGKGGRRAAARSEALPQENHQQPAAGENGHPPNSLQEHYREQLRKGGPIDLRKKGTPQEEPRIGQTGNEVVNLLSVAFQPMRLILHNHDPFKLEYREPQHSQVAMLRNALGAGEDLVKKFTVLESDKCGNVTRLHPTFDHPQQALDYIAAQQRGNHFSLLQPLVDLYRGLRQYVEQAKEFLKQLLHPSVSEGYQLHLYHTGELQKKLDELQQGGEIKVSTRQIAGAQVHQEPAAAKAEATEVVLPKNAHTADRPQVPNGKEQGATSSQATHAVAASASVASKSTTVVGDEGGVRLAASEDTKDKGEKKTPITQEDLTPEPPAKTRGMRR
ncbi:hypothetical protein V9K67_21500 [Paraflavisolibacter sp. H34]|uniref:hypothetical protein n=1 Tax=Huijunlia imazamoxiresistens TaxID=3127457 RepID=UPI0030169216